MPPEKKLNFYFLEREKTGKNLYSHGWKLEQNNGITGKILEKSNMFSQKIQEPTLSFISYVFRGFEDLFSNYDFLDQII